MFLTSGIMLLGMLQLGFTKILGWGEEKDINISIK